VTARFLSCNSVKIGEGLKKGDLPIREELKLGAAKGDCPDRDAFSYHGNAEYGPVPLLSRDPAALGKFVRLDLQIGDVNGPRVQHRSASDRPADQREVGFADHPVAKRAVMSDKAQPVVLPTKNRDVEGLA
jgi:hypothetical protein